MYLHVELPGALPGVTVRELLDRAELARLEEVLGEPDDRLDGVSRKRIVADEGNLHDPCRAELLKLVVAAPRRVEVRHVQQG